MDEVSPLGLTDVVEVRDGARVGSWRIDPAEHGFAGIDAADLAGGSPVEYAAVIEAVLAGEGAPGARAAVVLNAAAALYVAGVAPDYPAGVARATRAIDDGSGARALARLRAAYGRP
jgi:anthranilate phosphoribosyltransferase